MKAGRGMLWSALADWAGAVSRSGPMVPVAFAGLNVWQAPQPLERKTALPAATAAALPPDGAVVVVAAVVGAAVLVGGAVVAAAVEPTVTVRTTVAAGLPSEVKWPTAQPAKPAGKSRAANSRQSSTSPVEVHGLRRLGRGTGASLPTRAAGARR